MRAGVKNRLQTTELSIPKTIKNAIDLQNVFETENSSGIELKIVVSEEIIILFDLSRIL